MADTYNNNGKGSYARDAGSRTYAAQYTFSKGAGTLPVAYALEEGQRWAGCRKTCRTAQGCTCVGR